MGVPVGTAGGAGQWNRGPARPSPAPARSWCAHTAPARWAPSRLEGVETPPAEVGTPRILNIPQQRGPAWGRFPFLALPGLCPRKIRTHSAKGVPCFDPHQDGHCWSPGDGIPRPHLWEISCAPPPHGSSGAPHVPFLRASKINPSPWCWPESCGLKGLLPPAGATPSSSARSPGSSGTG